MTAGWIFNPYCNIFSKYCIIESKIGKGVFHSGVPAEGEPTIGLQLWVGFYIKNYLQKKIK
jgi:hypothetical protein